MSSVVSLVYFASISPQERYIKGFRTRSVRSSALGLGGLGLDDDSDCDDGLDVGLMVDNSNVEYMKFTAVKFMVVCVVVNK